MSMPWRKAAIWQADQKQAGRPDGKDGEEGRDEIPVLVPVLTQVRGERRKHQEFPEKPWEYTEIHPRSRNNMSLQDIPL